MSQSIDELYARWKQTPDAATTLSLCEALRGSGRTPVVQQVGEAAMKDHAASMPIMVATARMYMDSQRMHDAQTALVVAGKIDPLDPAVYRLLGEVLLRRGDADRAEKVLERAQQLGASDADTRVWLDRCKVFRPMQATAGTRSVAAEIAKTLTVKTSAVPPAMTTGVTRRGLPPMAPTPAPTVAAETKAASLLASPPTVKLTPASKAAPVAPLTAPVKPQPAPPAPSAARAPEPEAQPIIPLPPARAKMPSVDDEPTAEFKPAKGVPLALALGGDANVRLEMLTRPTGPSAAQPLTHDDSVTATFVKRHDDSDVFINPPPGTATKPATDKITEISLSGVEEDLEATLSVADKVPGLGATAKSQSSMPPPTASRGLMFGPASTAKTELGLPPFMAPPHVPDVPVRANGGADVYDPQKPGKPATMPDPRDVLDALTLAGIFEPQGSTTVAWAPREKARSRRKGTIFLCFAMFLFASTGFGLFRYIRDQRVKQHQIAETILTQIEVELHAARPTALLPVEANLGRAFELESRSPRAALDWLRERALLGLLKGGADIAFEDSIVRAKEVGITEDKIAFAYLASFLFQGDTAGAAALLTKWDGPAAGDAWYQLLAGAVLERAGDPRGAARYAAATKLDPELLVAETALVRVIAIDGDPQKARDLARAFRLKYPDRAEGTALVALAWGRDPERGESEPPEVADVIIHAAELPSALRVVPHAVAALRALDRHFPLDAKSEIQKGLLVADGPGVSSWLGGIALGTGDEKLTRKAALAAVSFSAVYPPARVLAARVALLGDRLDEALKATEELDVNSPDVGVVRAAVAYERVDSDGLGRALDAMPAESKKISFLIPLALAPDVLAGRVQLSPDKLVDMSDDEAPWADLVAMDMALDGGDLETGKKVALGWKGVDRRTLRTLRLARLARYSGDLEEADKLSEEARTSGTVTSRSLGERVLLLVARGRASEVGPLLARYPLVLGPLNVWLSAFATASAGKFDDARGRTASVDPPPASAPLPARIFAAVAFGAMRDHRRGNEYVAKLIASGVLNPDVTAAAVALGFRKIDRPGKRPTYAAP